MGRKIKRKKNRQEESYPLFYFFFGSLFLLLPLLHIPSIPDAALMPRLTAVAFVMLVTSLAFFSRSSNILLSARVVRQAVFWLLGGFLLITIVASFFAGNGHEVFFDNVRTLLVFSGVLLGSMILLRTPGWHMRLAHVAVLGSLPLILIGLVQYTGRVLLVDDRFLPDGRSIEYAVTGWMAHKNNFTAYMMLLLPFSLYGFFSLGRIWRVVSLLASLAMLLLIILLKTRSVWLSIALGSFVSVLLLITHARKFGIGYRWRKALWAAVVLGFIMAGGLIWTGRTAAPESMPGRLYSIIDLKSEHNIHRINVWTGSLEMAAGNLLLGVGPGNWVIVAPQHFNQQFTDVSALRWARPHNDYIWVLTEKGLIALLLYLAIFYWCFRSLYLQLRPAKGKHMQEPGQSAGSEARWKPVMALCLMGGFTAYLVDSFFAFPYERPNSQVALFTMMAITVAIGCSDQEASGGITGTMKARSATLLKKLLPLLALLIFGFSILYGYHVSRMGRHIQQISRQSAAGNWEAVLAHVQAAKTPFKILDYSLYPTPLYKGMAYTGLGRETEALTAFEEARRHSPHNVVVLDQLGRAYHRRGRIQDAIGCAREILEIIPGQRAALNNLGVYYYELGDYRQAHDMLTSIENWQEDPDIAHNVAIMRRLMDEGR